MLIFIFFTTYLFLTIFLLLFSSEILAELLTQENEHYETSNGQWKVDSDNKIIKSTRTKRKKRRKRAKVTNLIDLRSQFVRIQVISSVNSIPPMNTWTPIQKNFMIDGNDSLGNIPYMGDETSNYDNNVQEELNQSHEIAFIDAEEQVFIDDELFLELVNAVTKYKDYDDLEVDQNTPLNIVFEAMSAHFPNFGSADELKQRYDLLLEKNKEEQELICAPNIDSDYMESVSREQALHSYHTLFCRRCYMYNCFHHSK